MPRKKERIRRKVVVGHDPSGKPVVKWAIGYTNKEVEKKKQELIKEYVTGYTSAQSNVQYRYYVQQWYDVYKKPTLSASSKQNYASALNNHILPYIGDKQMQAVSAIDLQAIMNRLIGRGKTLVGDTYSILINSFAHAYAHGCIDRNPAADLSRPSTSRKKLRALTDDERAAALRVGATHPHGLILLILYYTGLRRGEALGLQWRDIDFENRTISVNRDVDFVTNDIGDVKTPAAIRTVPMPRALSDALRPLRGLPLVHVLQATRGGFVGQATYNRWWKQLMIAMLDAAPGIERCVVSNETVKVEGESGKKSKKEKNVDVYGSALTAHYFRHNYATVLYYAGVDVLTAQMYLGHTDPKTTISIYTHLDKQHESADAQRVHDAFENASAPLASDTSAPV